MIQRVSLEGDLELIEAYFNWISHDSFMEALGSFARGRGHSIEYADCDFPVDIAEDDHVQPEQIDHIRFWAYPENRRVSVSFAEFMGFLREAAEAEARLCPDRTERIRELVEATARVLSTPGRLRA